MHRLFAHGYLQMSQQSRSEQNHTPFRLRSVLVRDINYLKIMRPYAQIGKSRAVVFVALRIRTVLIRGVLNINIKIFLSAYSSVAQKNKSGIVVDQLPFDRKHRLLKNKFSRIHYFKEARS